MTPEMKPVVSTLRSSVGGDQDKVVVGDNGGADNQTTEHI